MNKQSEDVPNTFKLRSYTPVRKVPDIFETPPEGAIIDPDMKIQTMCIIGHVDAGKSTLMGKLLFLCGRVKQHTIDQYAKEAALYQKNTFELAFIMDNLKEERQRGVTIDCSYKEFNTEKTYLTIVDCPGHRDFLKNCFTGMSQADFAILALDCKKGIEGSPNAVEHILCAKALGVSSIIVALTKVDTIAHEQRERVYNQRLEEVKAHILARGFKADRVKIIPLNAYEGWNLIDNSHIPKEMPWYNGETLVEAIDSLPKEQQDPEGPLRMSVEGIHTKVAGCSGVVAGKILSGTLHPKDQILVNPGNHIGQVRRIQTHHCNLPKAGPGTNIGIDVTGLDIKKVKKGAVISHNNPATATQEVTQFVGERTMILDHPTQVGVNSCLIAHILTGHVSVKVKKLENVYDLKVYRGDFNEAAPDRDHKAPGYTHGEVKFVKPGSICKATFEPSRPIVVDTTDKHPKLSNLILRDVGKTVGVTKVTEIKTKKL